MGSVKRYFKRRSHNKFLGGLAGFGRAVNRFYQNRNHDFYSNGEHVVLKKISAQNPQVIVDGGANVGNFSVAACAVNPSCEIYAFEPVQTNFEKLKQNTSECQNVTPVMKGFYSSGCISEINLYKADSHSSLFDKEDSRNPVLDTISVELVAGDEFFDHSGVEYIDFLKLDLEGAEYEALLGFEKMLNEARIKAIQFEYGYKNIYTKRLLMDYYKLLEAHGFQIGKIFPRTVDFKSYHHSDEDFLGPNYLAVRSEETDLIQYLGNP